LTKDVLNVLNLNILNPNCFGEDLVVQLSNYLFFTTRCEEALNFYDKCGLGRAVDLMYHGSNGAPLRNENMRGKIMHAKFEGPGVLFYASDNDDAEPMRGSAHILMMHDKDQTQQLFELLGKAGTITTPLGIQPWGDYYGKLTDQFGVQWMLNCSV
jgi:PhnB protein